jgi:hypothetical protein
MSSSLTGEPFEDPQHTACLQLLKTYENLAERGEHLLDQLLAGQTPRQWAHYPEDDAIDHASGYQWFYHSHSPEDRARTLEHGHIHLFARRKLWSRCLRSSAELKFAELTRGDNQPVNTRHLLCIGLDARGIPISLFTVNSWVTDDLMLSAKNTIKLLDKLSLNTGNKPIDTVIKCIATICKQEIQQLLESRDHELFSTSKKSKPLRNQKLECLSKIKIDLEGQLATTLI